MFLINIIVIKLRYKIWKAFDNIKGFFKKIKSYGNRKF
jgi:hypothetical protein